MSDLNSSVNCWVIEKDSSTIVISCENFFCSRWNNSTVITTMNTSIVIRINKMNLSCSGDVTEVHIVENDSIMFILLKMT